jgi:hypothetical protein
MSGRLCLLVYRYVTLNEAPSAISVRSHRRSSFRHFSLNLGYTLFFNREVHRLFSNGAVSLDPTVIDDGFHSLPTGGTYYSNSFRLHRLNPP